MTKFKMITIVPLSTIDDPGYSTMVVFFDQCLLNCYYCHNKGLLNRGTYVDTEEIKPHIGLNSKYVSSITFSGGEPLLQPIALEELIDNAKAKGMQVALYTSGNHPDYLKPIIRKIDRLYVDFKLEEADITVDYDTYLRNFIRTLTIAEEGSVEVIVTVNVFELSDDVLDQIECIRDYVGDLMFVINQGILPDKKPLTADELKTVFQGYHIRTKENGIEWNG